LPFEEIDTFREKMIKAIQEVGKRKKEQENDEQGINSRRKNSIERIENLLRKKDIKPEELEPNNRDYKKAINDAEENEIVDIEDKIKDDIILK
jgi:DNA-binding protein H-NS